VKKSVEEKCEEKCSRNLSFTSSEPVNTPWGRAKLASLKQCSPFPRRINRLYNFFHNVSFTLFST